MPRKLILWAGPKHSGKTTAARRLVELARAENFTIAGILAPSVYEAGERVGFDVVDIATGRRSPLLRPAPERRRRTVGPYSVMDPGLCLGAHALRAQATRKADLVVVDEFGPAELDGKLWRGCVDRIVAERGKLLLLVVREELAERAAGLYPTAEPELVPAVQPGSVERVLAMLRGR